MVSDFDRAFESEWRVIVREIEEAMETWSHDDSTQREFQIRYWREIWEATNQYVNSLRELNETIAEVTRRLPCK